MRWLAGFAAASLLGACTVYIEDLPAGPDASEAGPLDGSSPGADASVPADGGQAADAGVQPAGKCPYSFSRSSSPAAASWERTGPPGGNVVSLLALGGGTVLAGTAASGGAGLSGEAAGLYRSTDSGASFSRAAPLKNTTVHGLVAVPGTGRVWASVGSASGSGDDGAWLSADRGASFAKTSGGLHAQARPRSLAAAPGAPERVWLMVEGSPAQPLSARATLYRSDGGGAWTATAMTGVSSSGGPALALAADATDRQRVYLANNLSFFASADGGETFTETAFDRPYSVRGLHADPKNAQHLVVTTHDEGLLESRDRGASWTFVAFAHGVRAVAFDGARTFAATDGGGLRLSTGGAFQPVGECLVDPVVPSVAVAPDDANLVLAGTSGGGVYRSADQGQHFTASRGIEELLARVSVTGPASAPAVWLLSAAGLFRSRDLGNTWERLAAEAGTLCFSGVAAGPAGAGALLATQEDLFPGGGAGKGVLRLSAADEVSPSSGLTGRNASAIAFDPTRPQRAFAYQCRGSSEDSAVPSGVFVSDDGGATFSASDLSAGMCGFDVSALAVAAGGAVYAGVLPGPAGPTNYRELWRSDDGGATFAKTWTGSDGFEARGVYVDASGNVLLTGRFGGSGGLKRSTDRGATFAEHGSGIGSPLVNGLAFAPGVGLVLATEGGVFWAADGASFSGLNAGLTALSTQGVAVAPAATAVVFAATADGVWRRTLP